ncbi:hypothetical protein [Methanosarcina barkeri]|uniref:Uncharacterized protein n=1 Tax=Methanosarcina barkeri (strain Fusaro / DSM 804) TaxID=269797 RepID=Q46ES7_METBF|nr:hypothetical protein [Methanosarcina barkeri]
MRISASKKLSFSDFVFVPTNSEPPGVLIPKYVKNDFLTTTESTEDTEISSKGRGSSVLSVVVISRLNHSATDCVFRGSNIQI